MTIPHCPFIYLNGEGHSEGKEYSLASLEPRPLNLWVCAQTIAVIGVEPAVKYSFV